MVVYNNYVHGDVLGFDMILEVVDSRWPLKKTGN